MGEGPRHRDEVPRRVRQAGLVERLPVEADDLLPDRELVDDPAAVDQHGAIRRRHGERAVGRLDRLHADHAGEVRHRRATPVAEVVGALPARLGGGDRAIQIGDLRERVVRARGGRDVGVVGAALERRDDAASPLELVGEGTGPAEERLALGRPGGVARVARERISLPPARDGRVAREGNAAVTNGPHEDAKPRGTP